MHFSSFIPEPFLLEYWNFIEKAFYLYGCIIRTGGFAIWRALIKYLERLQRISEFRNFKGKKFYLRTYLGS